ncbi:MAG: SAM-dependent methyltransferase [Clostridia bacterium]|nr:SAM-dependent methyltransferase [Clostridia bacterium]
MMDENTSANVHARDVRTGMSGRMLMVAKCVKECDCVFDAGSDHAFIPIYLVQRGICRRAVASDIRSGPAGVAQRNIGKYGLADRITASIGDGIENAAGCGCLIIAGMGGQLIKDILERSPGIARKSAQIILQPMNAPEKVRKYLWDNGYSIYSEDLCREKNKVYNVICARHTGESYDYEEFELHASAYLTKTGHPLLGGYLRPKLRRLRAMEKGQGPHGGNLKELIVKLEEIANENIGSTGGT